MDQLKEKAAAVYAKIKEIDLSPENIIPQEAIATTLDKCYTAALQGIPKTKSCYELAEEYRRKYSTPELAVRKFVNWQVAKCTTSGFLTSLGGLLTLPVTIPANLASVWYVQLRMIATIAILSGYDPSDDEVQTLAYLCLVGGSIGKAFREAGIKAGEKFAVGAIKKIPTEIINKINRIAAQRLITKFGEKGIINLGKMVPVVGGVIGGGFDFVGTHAIANKAAKTFLYGQID